MRAEMDLRVLLVLVAIVAAGVRATRFTAGDDLVVDADRRLYLAYVVREDDILAKMACTCVPRRHCGRHCDSVQLTE